jgi:hypothetical protein
LVLCEAYAEAVEGGQKWMSDKIKVFEDSQIRAEWNEDEQVVTQSRAVQNVACAIRSGAH